MSAGPHFEERVLFRSETLRVGSFCCTPEYSQFHDTGPIRRDIIVFPRTAVLITHEGQSSVVADPCVVMFYNQAQRYRRDKLSDRGDLCDWFSFDPAVIADILEPYDVRRDERIDRPFTFTHGPSDSGSYLLQRFIVEHLRAGDRIDRLLVEETMLDVLRRTTHSAYRIRRVGRNPVRPATARAHRDLVAAAKSLTTRNFRENASLAEIARAVHSSPYHLSRLFRRETGMTLHAYRNQLRLRTSLDAVLGGTENLAALALDLGYATHSHFTEAFRRAFGSPPSHVRRRRDLTLLQTSTIPTA